MIGWGRRPKKIKIQNGDWNWDGNGDGDGDTSTMHSRCCKDQQIFAASSTCNKFVYFLNTYL